MERRGRAARRAGWLERATALALVAVSVAALITAVRVGAAARSDGPDLLAEFRAATERRLAAERDQIRPLLASAARGDFAVALGGAEAALAGHGENSQLRLLLASLHRSRGENGPALREYRRALELVRDYADRRSPEYLGSALAPWLERVRASTTGQSLADLRFLQRALAGGCS